jgi:hypothetical protein
MRAKLFSEIKFDETMFPEKFTLQLAHVVAFEQLPKESHAKTVYPIGKEEGELTTKELEAEGSALAPATGLPEVVVFGAVEDVLMSCVTPVSAAEKLQLKLREPEARLFTAKKLEGEEGGVESRFTLIGSVAEFPARSVTRSVRLCAPSPKSKLPALKLTVLLVLLEEIDPLVTKVELSDSMREYVTDSFARKTKLVFTTLELIPPIVFGAIEFVIVIVGDVLSRI